MSSFKYIERWIIIRKRVIGIVINIIVVFLSLIVFINAQSKQQDVIVTNPIFKYQEFSYVENSDYVGDIRIPGTNINEHILKSSNNDYYLSHKEDGTYFKYGSITMDYRTNLSDRKVIIYGHNSKWYGIDIVPFKELEGYRNKSFYQKNRYVELVVNNKLIRYEIFSILETTDYSYIKLSIDSTSWYNHLLYLKSSSIYQVEVEVKEDDEILILQTCSFFKDNSYLVVIARKV